MSKILISGRPLQGQVQVPASKSDLHRAVICAALAGGVTEITPFDLNDDVVATVEAMRSIGVKTARVKNTLSMDATNLTDPAVPYSIKIGCGESGSTLRFLIPVLAALGYNIRFEGHGRLPYRPLDTYFQMLPQKGVGFTTREGRSLPFYMSGKLLPGTFEMPGNISSQFISGLLMALPLLEGDSELRLTSRLESARYVDMTLKTMNHFGVIAKKLENSFVIPGGQRYRTRDYIAESDWSQAAFFLAAGAINGDVCVEGLNPESVQGDKMIYSFLKSFGAHISWQEDGALHCAAGELKGISIDATHCPDLVPVLAVVAAVAKGRTVITGAARLRIKESDRLNAICQNLRKIGAAVSVQPDGLIIDGVEGFTGQKVEGFNDHRIVMAMAVAGGALHPKNTIEIDGAQAINKSYPQFFEHFKALGGHAYVV